MKKSGIIAAFLGIFMVVVPSKMYANFPAGIHSMYIGEVVNAWKK